MAAPRRNLICRLRAILLEPMLLRRLLLNVLSFPRRLPKCSPLADRGNHGQPEAIAAVAPAGLPCALLPQAATIGLSCVSAGCLIRLRAPPRSDAG